MTQIQLRYWLQKYVTNIHNSFVHELWTKKPVCKGVHIILVGGKGGGGFRDEKRILKSLEQRVWGLLCPLWSLNVCLIFWDVLITLSIIFKFQILTEGSNPMGSYPYGPHITFTYLTEHKKMLLLKSSFVAYMRYKKNNMTISEGIIKALDYKKLYLEKIPSRGLV